MADEPGKITISQVQIWMWRGRLVTELTHAELLTAFDDVATELWNLQQSARPSGKTACAGVGYKDRG